MPRYYFHFENGEILLDRSGVELPDIAAAQNEAMRATGDILKGGPRPAAPLWAGTPWRLWVSDTPSGEGKTFFTLRVSAEM